MTPGSDVGMFYGESIEQLLSDQRRARRERIATSILAGFAADNAMHSGPDAARMAVMWADALIAELDK